MAPLLGRDFDENNNSEPANPGGDELIRFCIAFTTTAGVFVAFRVGIRARRKLLGWDDFWIGVAFTFSILLMVATIISVKSGFGMHTDELDDTRVHNALFWWYLNQIFYKTITWPTKVSILLMYRRVFLVSNDIKAYGIQFRYLIWITLAVVVGCFVSFQTAGIFQCTPIRKSWNTSVPGDCTNKLSRMYAYAGCNFVTDVIILLLPMPLIYDMTHITKRQKTGLMAIFALGGFVCITTLLRISKLHISSDTLYSGQPSVLWTIIEANIGIICACLPLMRSVVIYLIPWFADRTTSRRSSSTKLSGQHSPRQSMNGHEAVRDSRDFRTSTLTQDEDTGSLSSEEEVTAEKVEQAVHVETAATSSTTDHRNQAEFDNSPKSNG